MTESTEKRPNSSHRSTSPSPKLFFEVARGYQRTAVLKAALDLDLFTAIGEGHQTANQLARRCEASERGMRILCDYLTIIGFLTKEGERYHLTPESSAFLDRRSPTCIASVLDFLYAPPMTDGFKTVTEAVRRGGTALPEEGPLAPEHPAWVNFARAMQPMAALMARSIPPLIDPHRAPRLKVLDIAAGHGEYGIALARHNPAAEIVALDWPNVLRVAVENAEKAGIGDRYRTIAGSAFDADWGSGYDVVLLNNFLHHFDPPTCERLLRKVHAALVVDGRAVALEFVPNEDRVTPPETAAFSMIMLVTTPRGDAYTFAQYQEMFHNAGFSRTELVTLPPPSAQQLVISHKEAE